MKNIETNTNEYDLENETKIKKSICLRLRDCNEKHFPEYLYISSYRSYQNI